MHRQELEKQYSPSRWSRRFQDPADVISNHVRVVTEVSNAVKQKVPADCGVQYGPKQGQKLDVFGGPLLPKDAPLLVYVHGGYWQELCRDTSAYCVEPLHSAGIRVVVVGYDLAPAVKLDEIVEEIKMAALHVLNMAVGLGARSVWFAGHSAGAHLVSMLQFSGWLAEMKPELHRLVKGFVLISGVYDVTAIVDTYINDALGLTRSEAEALSPMLLPASPEPNLCTLVALAEHDSPEFHRQSERFAEKLRSMGQDAQLMVVSDVDHFDIVEKLHCDDFQLTKKIKSLVLKDP